MGMRPEDIHDEKRFLDAYPDATVNAYVEVIELLGSETNLFLLISGKDTNTTATVDPRSTSRSGDNIRVAFDMDRVHFFDKDTEASILKV